MSKHLAPTTIIDAAIHPAHKTHRRIVWLIVCGVVTAFYVADMTHCLLLGVIFDHVSELIIGTGVTRFIGEA